MMNILLIVLLSFHAFSNCELLSFGYHTVATYDSMPKNYLILPYYFSDPYMVVQSTILDNSHPPKPTSKLIIKSATVNGNEECIKEGEIHEFTSAFTGYTYTRVPICKKEFSVTQATNAFALVDKELQTVRFPHQMMGVHVTTKDFITSKIESNIDSFLKTHEFRATKSYILLPSKIKSKKYTHFQFNSSFYSTTVDIESFDSKTYSAVFLSNPSESWYVADSGGIEHCGEGDKDLTRESRLGWVGNIKTGFDYNRDGTPEIIKFDEPDIYYYIQFKKYMHVIQNLDDRMSMSHGIDVGFVPMKNKK